MLAACLPLCPEKPIHAWAQILKQQPQKQAAEKRSRQDSCDIVIELQHACGSIRKHNVYRLQPARAPSVWPSGAGRRCAARRAGGRRRARPRGRLYIVQL